MWASWRGTACLVASSACSSRSPSSYQSGRSRRDVSWLTRAASRPRGDDAVSAATASGPARRSSRWRSRRATTVDGCSATAANEPGASASTRRIGEVDDRRRHGGAAVGHQRRRPDQLGEPVQRQHVDGGDAAEPAERPAGHHAGRVGRHDHRDRGERIAGLGPTDGAGQRVEGAAGRDGVDADRHSPDRREGVRASRAGSVLRAAASAGRPQRGDGVAEAFRIAVEGAAGDQHVGAGGGRAGDRGRADPAVDLDVDGVGRARRRRACAAPRRSWAPSSAMYAWPPNPGLTVITSTRSTRSSTWATADGRRRRVERDRRRGAQSS